MLIFSKLADLCVYLLSHLYCRFYITVISTSFSKACAFNGYTPSPQTPQMYYLFIIYLSIIVVHVQLSPSSHLHFSPSSTSHPQSFPPLALSMGLLYMFLDEPFPSLPCYPSSLFPLLTVSVFFISMFLVIFCLLVCIVD